jgi:pectin methylesterase-like acyl-CoA thioesterase
VSILHVGTGPGDFAHIQDAVDAALNGDTIDIAAGTYREQVTISGKVLTIHGAGDGAKDSALVAAGTELRLVNGVSLIGKFDGEFARRSSTYAGTGTVRYAW